MLSRKACRAKKRSRTLRIMSIFEQTASEHLRNLQAGQISSIELTRAYLDRITAVDERILAFLRVDGERALKQAEEIDARRARKQVVGRLAGLPLAIKDILCERGQTTTCASRILENFKSPYDST